MIDLLMSLLVWFGIFANLILGLLVFGRDPRSRVNRALTFMAGITAVWAAGLFFFEEAGR